jgi:hypothetical protein
MVRGAPTRRLRPLGRGSIERGAAHERWRAHDYRAQVHPATLCVFRDLLAFCGWMALLVSENAGLLLALNA